MPLSAPASHRTISRDLTSQRTTLASVLQLQENVTLNEFKNWQCRDDCQHAQHKRTDGTTLEDSTKVQLLLCRGKQGQRGFSRHSAAESCMLACELTPVSRPLTFHPFTGASKGTNATRADIKRAQNEDTKPVRLQ